MPDIDESDFWTEEDMREWSASAIDRAEAWGLWGDKCLIPLQPGEPLDTEMCPGERPA